MFFQLSIVPVLVGALSLACCLVTGLPTLPDSQLFPYRTNFFNVLRLKSRLVTNSAARRNATAAFLQIQQQQLTDSNNSMTVPEVSTTETPTTTVGSLIGPAAFAMCGVPTNVIPHRAPSSSEGARQSRIVGGEMVHHGEFPWMVSTILHDDHQNCSPQKNIVCAPSIKFKTTQIIFSYNFTH